MIAPMNKAEVIQHFGSVGETARALGLSQPSVTNWGDQLPILRQLEIERLTRGVLKAGPECNRFRVGAKPPSVAA